MDTLRSFILRPCWRLMLLMMAVSVPAAFLLVCCALLFVFLALRSLCSGQPIDALIAFITALVLCCCTVLPLALRDLACALEETTARRLSSPECSAALRNAGLRLLILAVTLAMLPVCMFLNVFTHVAGIGLAGMAGHYRMPLWCLPLWYIAAACAAAAIPLLIVSRRKGVTLRARVEPTHAGFRHRYSHQLRRCCLLLLLRLVSAMPHGDAPQASDAITHKRMLASLPEAREHICTLILMASGRYARSLASTAMSR